MKLRIAGVLAAAFLVLALGGAAQAKCGKVSISEMNWNSAAVAAHVQAIILEKGYGCDVDLVPGDSVPTITSMTEKGEPDVAPEIWINSVKEMVGKAEKEGRLQITGEILSDGGEEGWWVPEYVVKANPELTTLDAIKKRPDLFADKEDPGKGRFYGCPSGWACQIINANLFKAYGMKEAKFNLFDPGSGPGLAGAIARAYERKQPIFTYYWAPTSVLGKYPMVKVGGMKHDPKTYACIQDKDCADPKPNMYPKSRVLTAVVGKFEEREPDAFKFVSSVSWSNSVLNKLLAWKDDNKADAAETAEHFIKTGGAVWTKWVSADVAAKVKAGK